LVCVLAAWWSVCRDLGGGGAGAGFVDDGFAAGVGGDEGLDGQVAGGPGQAAAGGVDQRGGVLRYLGFSRSKITLPQVLLSRTRLRQEGQTRQRRGS